MYKNYVKRFLDILFSFFLIVLLSPIMLIVAIAIKLESRGPILFKQNRSGLNGKVFKLWKFRSMTKNNNVYDFSCEDVITKVGKFIRKTSLDELPQLFLIFKGDMSFIGPRPWVTKYADFFTMEQARRLEVLPGITGLAQCNGRNNMSVSKKIDMDIKYVDNLSFTFDIYIILKTILSVIKTEGTESSKYAVKNDIEVLKDNYEKEVDKYFIPV